MEEPLPIGADGALRPPPLPSRSMTPAAASALSVSLVANRGTQFGHESSMNYNNGVVRWLGVIETSI
jgi:hypothetical protein